jgi:hypothetical protein
MFQIWESSSRGSVNGWYLAGNRDSARPIGSGTYPNPHLGSIDHSLFNHPKIFLTSTCLGGFLVGMPLLSERLSAEIASCQHHSPSSGNAPSHHLSHSRNLVPEFQLAEKILWELWEVPIKILRKWLNPSLSYKTPRTNASLPCSGCLQNLDRRFGRCHWGKVSYISYISVKDLDMWSVNLRSFRNRKRVSISVGTQSFWGKIETTLHLKFVRSRRIGKFIWRGCYGSSQRIDRIIRRDCWGYS